MKNISIYIFLAISILVGLPACSEDDFGETIFDTTESELDPSSYSYPFDCWLRDNFLNGYNLDFRYRMQDVGTDMSYNLVPATYENSIDMALLLKYLWLDAYNEVGSESFMKENSPRIVHLIGSPAFNPVNGTMVLGLAEGGLKISLFRCNALDYTDIAMMNEYYFKTMHHEFAHILHQKKTYPKEFRTLSSNYYEPNKWQERDEKVVASLGFVSPYGGSQEREDFVEVIANYIVKTDADWSQILDWASKGWKLQGSAYVESEDTDGVDGKAVILQKLGICRTWLADAWGIDLDKLRESVQRRQATIDIVELRKELDQYRALRSETKNADNKK